jgi:hypothetical protein
LNLRAKITAAVKTEIPIIRRKFVVYSPERAKTAIDRLRDYEPQSNWEIDTIFFSPYIAGLAGRSDQSKEIAAQVGSFLMAGFEPSESLAAIEVIAENAFSSGSFVPPLPKLWQ